MKLIKVSLLSLLSIILLSGCNTLRIGYTYADWFIVNKIDNMFDLNSSQRQKVNEIVDELHHWHRTEEIPRLITFLDQARNRVVTELKKEDIQWLHQEAEAMKVRIVEYVADDLSELMTSLNEEQINHLETYLAEHNLEDEEKYTMPLVEWEDEQKERIVENLHSWFGELSQQQEEILIKAFHVDRSVHQQHHEQAVQFQKRFVALLRQKPSAHELRNTLHNWILEPESLYSGEYTEFQRQQKANRLNFYFTIDQTINDSQRQHALQKLESYQYDFEAIYMSSL